MCGIGLEFVVFALLLCRIEVDFIISRSRLWVYDLDVL
jgi:hypothetical protein